MFSAEGNLVFVQWSSNLSDGDHILPTQALDLETNLGFFFFEGGGKLAERSALHSHLPPHPHNPFKLTWIHT